MRVAQNLNKLFRYYCVLPIFHTLYKFFVTYLVIFIYVFSKNADVVATCSGLPPNSHLTDIQLFELNASVVHKIALYCAEICPAAMFCCITSPVTCLVPMVSEVIKILIRIINFVV